MKAAAHRSQVRIRKILDALKHSIPTVEVELDHRTPWELLVATILSAQCTDQRVNQVTPNLFRRYRRPSEYARADLADLEELIRSTGFFKNKAKHLVACGQAITERFRGQVPATMEELTTLPGVGRKTANVILGHAFGKPGIVVDTHVTRVSNRLGLTTSDNPEQIERDLQQLIPESQWTAASHRLLLHGRYVCLARKPHCAQCVVSSLCHWKGKLVP
jgi:endonuclease-3